MIKGNNKAIYLLIADKIIDDVLSGKLRPDDRLPSIREYAAEVQVNPNTMMRTYDFLSSREVIYNRRGVGYFLSADAPAIVAEMRHKQLMDDELDQIFRQLSLLGVSPEELTERYTRYLKNDNNNNINNISEK